MPRSSPVRAPATRDQVDAYRFGLRRLEAALVRGDPVPLHEQIRSQRRAALAGVALGLLGLCGAAVWAKVSPQPIWEHQSIVVGASSGAMYVVAHQPDRLVPVANLPAARLVLAALHAGGSTGADPATATPVEVPDKTLDGAARTPAAAVPGALAVRPDAVIAPRWAVCDRVTPRGELTGTTVVGGAAAIMSGPAGDAVLLAGPDRRAWLVTGSRRHRVDFDDGRLVAALGLTGRAPRAATSALLSVLPEGEPLSTPVVPGRGGPAPARLPGRVGDVLVAHPLGATAVDAPHYVVLPGGVQQVPPLLAELLRVTAGQERAREVDSADLAGVTVLGLLPVEGWPTVVPHLREAADAGTVCWIWTPDGTGVWTGAAPPDDRPVVTLAQADGPGGFVDAVSVGSGGAVRVRPPGAAPGVGPLWLVSATGVAHGVADNPTAAALGISAAEPAPEAALALLPQGPPLDLAAATVAADVRPPG